MTAADQVDSGSPQPRRVIGTVLPKELAALLLTLAAPGAPPFRRTRRSASSAWPRAPCTTLAAMPTRARTVEVTFRGLDGGLQLAVRDDGIGFNPARQREHPTLGLTSMRERVHLMAGEPDIESAPGQGTIILAWVPLRNESP